MRYKNVEIKLESDHMFAAFLKGDKTIRSNSYEGIVKKIDSSIKGKYVVKDKMALLPNVFSDKGGMDKVIIAQTGYVYDEAEGSVDIIYNLPGKKESWLISSNDLVCICPRNARKMKAYNALIKKIDRSSAKAIQLGTREFEAYRKQQDLWHSMKDIDVKVKPQLSEAPVVVEPRVLTGREESAGWVGDVQIVLTEDHEFAANVLGKIMKSNTYMGLVRQIKASPVMHEERLAVEDGVAFYEDHERRECKKVTVHRIKPRKESLRYLWDKTVFDVRITFDVDGKRESVKVRSDYLKKVSPENSKKAEAYNVLSKERIRLSAAKDRLGEEGYGYREKQKELLASMERVKVEIIPIPKGEYNSAKTLISPESVDLFAGANGTRKLK